MGDDVVIVIGCGMRRYREYLLASASKRHALWLFNATEPTWQAEYIAGCTVLPDILDRDVVLAAAKELAGQRKVVGVLSWDETLVVAVAHVAAALGLPGAGIDGIEGCRDKQRNRRVLTEAGLPQPAFRWAATEYDAVAAAEEIGYPVVVKPRGMGASIGVVRADDADGVRAAFHTAEDSSYDGARAYHGGALIEEYLDGAEISVDAAVLDGEYLPMFIGRKDVGMQPYFEELGHTVDANDSLFDSVELLRVLRDAHTAIGFGFGITHTEVKLTKRGPVIVEINGRLGGDLIPFLGSQATGIDPGVAVVDIALGNKPDLARKFERVVGIRFGYPPQDCVVKSISVPEPNDEKSILAAAPIVDPGTELRLPPGGYISRYAYVICSGIDTRECVRNMDNAMENVRLDWQPLNAK